MAPWIWVRIDFGNSESPVCHQAIIWTNANFLSIGHMRTNFSEIRVQTKRMNDVISWNVSEHVVYKISEVGYQQAPWGLLTHWGRDKMAAISQTMFWNAFSWMKMYEFCLRFLRNVFLRIELTIFQHWFRQWLGAEQATRHCLNQWCLDNRRTYASRGLNESSFTCFLSSSSACQWFSSIFVD